MTDEQKQKIKEYQKEYRKNMTYEQKQKQKIKEYQKSTVKRENLIIKMNKIFNVIIKV